MSNEISLEYVRSVMGDNLIGPDEIRSLKELDLRVDVSFCELPVSLDELKKKKDDYLLILGISHFSSDRDVTIRNFIDVFGKDPQISEPCFYNQDWYDKESFIDVPMKDEWFFVRKEVFDDSRAVQPEELMKRYEFPSAIRCAYAFFMTWLVRDIILWKHDFVWCSDTDHNGDRIYVGRYCDKDGVNKNGFNIHRHLALRDCYGCV